jgi:HEAT repeat protein
VNKRATKKLIAFSSVAVVCFALVYYLLPHSDNNTPPSPRAKNVKQKSTASAPVAGSSSPKVDRRNEPQANASGPEESKSVSPAEAALTDPDIYKRVQAVHSLRGELTPEAVSLLSKYMDDPEQTVVTAAINTLGVIGVATENAVLKKLVLDALLEKAKDNTFPFRGVALINGAMLGEDDRTFQLIGEYIAEDGDDGKGFAVRALSFLKSPASVPYLSEVMGKTKDLEVMKNASAVLAKIGTPEAVAMLSERLNSRREDEQATSAWALAMRNDDTSRAALIDAVSSNKLSETALSAVARSAAAPAVFQGALNLNISKEDKLYVLGVISAYSNAAPASVRNEMAEVIKPIVNSDDRDLKLAAIEALGKVGANEDQSSTLTQQFNSPDFMVRGAALDAFIPYCNQSSYKELIRLWSDDDEKIRRTAFWLSQMFVNKSDLEALQKATTSKDQYIAKTAQKVVHNLTEKTM